MCRYLAKSSNIDLAKQISSKIQQYCSIDAALTLSVIVQTILVHCPIFVELGGGVDDALV